MGVAQPKLRPGGDLHPPATSITGRVVGGFFRVAVIVGQAVGECRGGVNLRIGGVGVGVSKGNPYWNSSCELLTLTFGLLGTETRQSRGRDSGWLSNALGRELDWETTWGGVKNAMQKMSKDAKNSKNATS